MNGPWRRYNPVFHRPPPRTPGTAALLALQMTTSIHWPLPAPIPARAQWSDRTNAPIAPVSSPPTQVFNVTCLPTSETPPDILPIYEGLLVFNAVTVRENSTAIALSPNIVDVPIPMNIMPTALPEFPYQAATGHS